ncbi:universal stress protein [Noviherbaspirillum aerium]|uniref:universal stress protein n=1 Tax=Noviherbaspirillum aerium TaxID=2588497 RepID=UPI00124EDE21|nr:universal stress protein [Noviherbaspirillum aerium]
MKKILVPVSIHSSPAQLRSAAAEAIAIYYGETSVQVHLLSVQVPLSLHVAEFFDCGELRQIHLDAGKAELAPVAAALDKADVPYLTHIETGRTAETIVRFATETKCDRIIMGKAPQAGFAEKLFGTLASEVRHLLGRSGSCRVIGS